MSKVIVARPVNGITLNGDLEFLLDNTGEVKVFDSPEEAKSFLIVSAVDSEELRHMTIMESCGICRRCGVQESFGGLCLPVFYLWRGLLQI